MKHCNLHGAKKAFPCDIVNLQGPNNLEKSFSNVVLLPLRCVCWWKGESEERCQLSTYQQFRNRLKKLALLSCVSANRTQAPGLTVPRRLTTDRRDSCIVPELPRQWLWQSPEEAGRSSAER